jgi:Tol biopolymer transport system component
VFTPTPITVPREAVFFQDHYYLVVDIPVTWHQAVEISEKENGHLVTISSGRENQFVAELVGNHGLDNFQIGLTDEEVEGTFRWITGELLIFQNWAIGEPNNESNEDYVEMDAGSGNQWNDFRNEPLPFVIEWDEFGGRPPTNIPSPTPTATALPELPNLTPANVPQWDGPLVTSSVQSPFLALPGLFEDKFLTGQEFYVNWTIVNDSPTAASEPFVVGILIDGTLVREFKVLRLDAGDIHRQVNIPLTIDEPGEHEVTLVIDMNNQIAESNERDNTVAIYPVWRAKADIVFVSDRDGNSEIYTMTADGSNQTRLTFDKAIDGFPAWSPDGSMIAFESERSGNYEVYVMNADGSDQRNITRDRSLDSAPSWSPDGSRIAFVSNREGNFDVFVMNADGSDQTRLTHDSATDDFPSWSADGSRIIFESNRAGDYNIYSMNPDGTGLEQVTRKTSSDNHARISPDGKTLVFVSNRAGDNEIYISNVDITSLTQLTIHEGSDNWPNWSPDSKTIVFHSNRDGGLDRIFTVSADGKTMRALTGNDSNDKYPHWSLR